MKNNKFLIDYMGMQKKGKNNMRIKKIWKNYNNKRLNSNKEVNSIWKY